MTNGHLGYTGVRSVNPADHS